MSEVNKVHAIKAYILPIGPFCIFIFINLDCGFVRLFWGKLSTHQPTCGEA